MPSHAGRFIAEARITFVTWWRDVPRYITDPITLTIFDCALNVITTIEFPEDNEQFVYEITEGRVLVDTMRIKNPNPSC